MFRKFLIPDTDQFVSSEFPQLDESLHQLTVLLTNYSQGTTTEMILSFVKDHSMSSRQVKEYPELATLISSNSLPLSVMEALFDSSRQNALFRKQLEDYIGKYFLDKKL